MSTSKVDSWGYGSTSDYAWFSSAVNWAMWWYFGLGPDPDTGCVASSLAKPVSNFSSTKFVRFGKLQDVNGVYLDGGFDNYIVVDQYIQVGIREMTHQVIQATEVVYLRMTGPGANVFTVFCAMAGLSESDATCNVFPAISFDRLQPVIAADASLEHAIGTIAKNPTFPSPPQNPSATIVFLNQAAMFNGDAFANAVLQQNWTATQVDHRLDGQPVLMHTTTIYAVGTQAEVAHALAAVRTRFQAGIHILTDGPP